MANNKKKKNKKSTYNKKDNDKDNKKKKKAYKNWVASPVGKTIICVLALLMLFSGLISLIILLVLNAR